MYSERRTNLKLYLNIVLDVVLTVALLGFLLPATVSCGESLIAFGSIILAFIIVPIYAKFKFKFYTKELN